MEKFEWCNSALEISVLRILQKHGCSLPRGARSQGISSYVENLVLSEYTDFSTR